MSETTSTQRTGIDPRNPMNLDLICESAPRADGQQWKIIISDDPIPDNEKQGWDCCFCPGDGDDFKLRGHDTNQNFSGHKPLKGAGIAVLMRKL